MRVKIHLLEKVDKLFARQDTFVREGFTNCLRVKIHLLEKVYKLFARQDTFVREGLQIVCASRYIC